jgi:probable rRNA maturation factor
MIQVNFFIGSRYPVKRKVLRDTVERVLADHKITHAQVDVSIVGSRKITTLNESKLQHTGETDVLSFPQHERNQLNDFPLPPDVPPHLGDIVISFPEAVKTAKRYGKLVDWQLSFYLEHGLLHLLGYHHD